MNKLFTAALLGAAMLVPATNYADANAEAALAEKEEAPTWFEAGVDLDLFSAYVWRNAVMHDELVFQPGVWFDFTRIEPLYIGGFVWQNWNLCGNPTKCGMPRAMNETDFNVHLGATCWESEDEEYSLYLEAGNDFYTYRQQEDVPNSYEYYLKAQFDNPYVGVYGQYSQAYEPIFAPYFEAGLKKEVNVGEALESESDFLNRFKVGADWNMSFASGKYFTNYLYGTLPGEYDPESGDYDDRAMSNGLGGTTIKCNMAYQVCDHFSVGLVLAYTTALSGEVCDAMTWAENSNMYKRLLWGGLQAKVEF